MKDCCPRNSRTTNEILQQANTNLHKEIKALEAKVGYVEGELKAVYGWAKEVRAAIMAKNGTRCRQLAIEIDVLLKFEEEK